MKTFQVLILSLMMGISSAAQQPEQVLNQWSSRTPIEKVYLHLDRDNYVAGETIWFKAYMYSEFLPDTISTTLYVELMNQNSAILSRKSFPVILGYTNGQIEIPDSLLTGNYSIRAYSTTMLNLDTAFLYRREVFVSGKKLQLPSKSKDNIIDIEFFPESGNFVSGLMNTVAFKATNSAGMPKEVKGTIWNQEQQQVERFESFHDGMGMFDIKPSDKENLYATIDGDASGKKYPLPVPVASGLVLRLMPDPLGNYFILQQNSGDPMQSAAYIIGQMQHHVVFRLDFPKGKTEINGTIKTGNLSSGVLQVTVFNKDGVPLAERLVFVDNKEYIQRSTLVLDTINVSDRSKNVFSIQFDSAIVGNLSVSVTDPAYSLSDRREENIYSSLLLTSDIKGYVHDPAWYFLSDNDSVKNALDLVMMTNGWRRFKWVDIIKSLPPGNYKDGKYITLSGQLLLSGTKRPFSNRPFVTFISSPDSTKSMQLAATDLAGYFRIDSLVFFDRSRILFKDIRGKKSEELDVNMAADSLMRSFRLPGVPMRPFAFTDSTYNNKLNKLAIDWQAIEKASGIMLQGITVKTRKKSPVEELEEKYTSGLFSGFSEKTIDLVNNGQTIYQQNIFDYLSTIIPGLQVVKDGFDYSIYYRQGPTASSMGAIPMTLYLDEFPVDASVISVIPPNDVALVKVFNSFVGAAGNGPGGVLAIYMRKGKDLYSTSSSNENILYRGYSVIKEFYSPDYSLNKKDDKADNRITLDWIPNIYVLGQNKIPIKFFNNDRTRQFKVVVEGMTVDGKMIFLEQKFPSDQRKGF